MISISDLLKWFYSREGLCSFPLVNYFLFVIGLLFVPFGVLIIRWASPSPHGYVELLFGIPTICGGLVFSGVALLSRYSMLNWPVRLFAFSLIVVALLPILGLALLVVGI
jgi:hypothetical protein